MNKNLLIVGAGQYGMLAREIAESLGEFYKIDFLDDNNSVAIGKIVEYMDFASEYAFAFVAIGNCDLRLSLIEKLQKANAAKTGGIIHIGHFTNWEAFGLGVSAAGIDSIVMAQRVDNPYVDEETNRLRHVFGGFTIYSNHDAKPFFATMRQLKKGRLLGILTDQNVVSAEIFMHFLGRPAAISPITALLAIRQKVPIFPVIVTRENGKLICTVEDPITTNLEYSMDNVRLLTRQLIDIYERWIRQNPDNWLWAHNRWKREEEGKRWFAEHPECQTK